MVLRAEFKDAVLFKRLVDLMITTFDDIVIHANASGLSVRVMDQAHTCNLDLTLSAKLFQLYECGEEQELGINLEALHRSIRNISDGTPLQLQKGDDAGEPLRIISEDITGGRWRCAEVHLIQVANPGLTIPDMPYKGTLDLSTSLFSTLLKDVSTTTAGARGDDAVTITLTAEEVIFKAASDNSCVTNKLLKGQAMWQIDREDGPIEICLPVKVLTNTAKACNLSDTIRLHIAPGMPLRVDVILGEESCATYHIAPSAV